MPDFDYLAIDTRGAEKRGHVAADTLDAARARLDRQRLYVVRLEPGSAPVTTVRPLFGLQLGRPRMRAKQLTLFTRQLATLNRVSPLEESLRTITRQTEQEGVRRVVEVVHAGVVEGRRLADAMAREPKSFPPLYRAMVSAGESSGSLPTILDRLAALLERQAEIRGKLITALAYPTILAAVALGVVTALMVFVVPQVVEQFDTVGQELPFLTRFVIGLSDLLVRFWWVILLVAGLIGLGMWQALRQPARDHGRQGPAHPRRMQVAQQPPEQRQSQQPRVEGEADGGVAQRLPDADADQREAEQQQPPEPHQEVG